MIEVYTDGAYSSSRNQGGLGIVFIKDDKVIAKFSKTYKNTTNNRMELMAVIIALRSIKDENEITIYSDSMYVIGTATQGWKRKKNLDLWEKYDAVIDSFKTVTFKHVKGHSTNMFNNLCDEMAVAASQAYAGLD